jgi:hypothetical protein
MPATYEPIATQTLGSAASTITFSSIPATYTDLRLVFVGKSETTNGMAIGLQYNGDTNTNYSTTFLYGNATASYREINQPRINLASTVNVAGLDNVSLSMWEIDILSYTSAVHKTCMFSGGQNYWNVVNEGVSLWRSTATINQISFVSNSTNNYAIGTTVTLYGIKAA